MDYENLLRSGGDNGIFQMVVFFALVFASFNCGVEISTMVIALHEPRHACVPPNYSNQTQNINFSNFTKEFDSNSTCFYDYDNETRPCTQWIYDKSYIGNTLVTEFNLICSKKAYQDHIYTAYFLGQVIAMALNSLGDIIGRRKFILACCVWETALNLAMALVPGLFPQLGIRFLRSMSNGLFVQCIALLAELVTIKYRGLFLNLSWIFWCFGTMGGSVFAYVGYDWRTIKLIGLIPSIVYISYVWIVPESPRWLIVKGKRKEAENILKRIALWNRIPWNENSFDHLDIKKEPTGRIKDLFRTPNIRRKTLVMSFVQWSFCLCYYGLTSDPDLFSKNIYLGLFLQGLVEIPTSLFAVILCKYLGRKRPCLLLIVLTSLFLIAVPFIRNAGYEISSTITALCGKLFMVIGFIIIDCMNSEIYPTTTRAMGLTVTNFIGSTGNILAAYINRTGDYAYYIPSVIYSVQVAICGILIFTFIPEMSKCPLPQTVEEAEKLYAHKEDEWIQWMKDKTEVEEMQPLPVDFEDNVHS